MTPSMASQGECHHVTVDMTMLKALSYIFVYFKFIQITKLNLQIENNVQYVFSVLLLCLFLIG